MSTDRVPLPAMSPKRWRRSGSHPPCDRLRLVHVQCGIINYKDLILHRKPESFFVKNKTHKLFVCHNNWFGTGILLLTTRWQVWFLTLVLISLVLLSDYIGKIWGVLAFKGLRFAGFQGLLRNQDLLSSDQGGVTRCCSCSEIIFPYSMQFDASFRAGQSRHLQTIFQV